ncbi:histidine ammonia-lyase [Endozoicomonas sp. SCSIO W0465]|uniref:histidine ammonia-lyase n=1 Tax=Endozoicomonas sp. SCSIO W0465 TaxID=2918516 RepID=UPI0020766504|nr:histidine ammonia-lyase [Endozoicomonas sp. SCSIO W0465]USE37569.1 histidine ammonia-lyase [Endozoicomonas sp. SCSIO W0465]
MSELVISPGKLSLSDLRKVSRYEVQIKLDPACYPAINKSVACVNQALAENRVVYGINTGFGLLANTRIQDRELEALQRSIVLSHATGVGQFMDQSTVRLMMVLKINSLARGLSGVRLELIDALMQLINLGVYPCVPEKGSVGASGDLAPLAHMSCLLLGEGHALVNGQQMTAMEALAYAGMEPMKLAPKEGLALLNGTQASTAFALQGLFGAEDLMASAVIAGSLSVEAAMGSRRPFDPRIHQARGLKGQIDIAHAYRITLDHSDIGQAHIDCDKVQDPYSLRCQPQVMGACLEQMRYAARLLEVEANGVTDNPLVFVEENEILSGGNFHAEPTGMAAEALALAIAEIGAISERRIALLVDQHLSGLPPFLVKNSGVNSGFMIAHNTAAALASENRCLCHPSVADSLPTSANQEDHVSMATYGARRLREMNGNTSSIVGIELLAAAQGVDMRKPYKTSKTLQRVMKTVRKDIPFYDQDRYFFPDIQKASELVASGELNCYMPTELLPSYS